MTELKFTFSTAFMVLALLAQIVMGALGLFGYVSLFFATLPMLIIGAVIMIMSLALFIVSAGRMNGLD